MIVLFRLEQEGRVHEKVGQSEERLEPELETTDFVYVFLSLLSLLKRRIHRPMGLKL